MNRESLIEQVRTALAHQQRVSLHRHPVAITLNVDGTITLEGEVADVAAKKLALETTAALEGVNGVIDRLRVARAERMSDAEIRDHVCDAISSDSVFLGYEINRVAQGVPGDSKSIETGKHAIFVIVNEGIVTLDGVVASLSHKRIAGVLAWWVPGTRDVIDGLEVQPPEQDSDDEITEALRLVLDKDPLVNAEEIRITTRDGIVTLTGLAHNDQERRAAENDGWCLFGVNKVIDRIVVH
jgi:osmotically-inducible protein OsmY